ncbi:heterokaryon incompatibility protein-domain-containing protein [Astrocystis sublimbata]|nr:heterokaryon incompatibility protein-domain-containing protein [Astrocystis sublimbata]
MIPPYPFRRYVHSDYKYQEFENRPGDYLDYGKKVIEEVEEIEDSSGSYRCGIARCITRLFTGQRPAFCQVCLDRKLDFRSLTRRPPKAPTNYPYDSIEDDVLLDLEMKNAVHVKDFVFAEANATKTRCRLCRLLYSAVDQREGFLLKMPTACIIRPRYDWLGPARKKTFYRERFRIIHKYQIVIEIVGLEDECVYDMLCPEAGEYPSRGRFAVPAFIDTKLLASWVHQCDENHEHPAVSATTFSRMQSITSRGLFRAINTSTGSVEVHNSLPKFVALSYVWGKRGDEPDNHTPKSKPISSHVPTIRDAAIVAASLGFQWIWVDRICIDQSSETEKAILIPYMKDIYAAAQLTIVAARGDSAQSGLLDTRNPERYLRFNFSLSVLVVSGFLRKLIDKSAWGSRGWTFEEHVFSRRLLFFFDSEVIFKCGSHTFRESRGVHSTMQLPEVDRGIHARDWEPNAEVLRGGIQKNPDNVSQAMQIRPLLRALQEYGERSLTFEADRVAAFSGVILAAMADPLDEISEQSLLRHGQPLHLFEALLLWDNWAYIPSERRPARPFESGFPSWSWASSPGPFFYDGSPEPVAKTLDHAWFRYTLLHNHDILALPNNNNLFPFLPIGGQDLPSGLIDSELSENLPLYCKALTPTDTPMCKPPSMPSLHMVTVVFNARLACSNPPDDLVPKYVLVPQESTEWSEEICANSRFYKKSWGLHPELWSRYESEAARSTSPPLDTFAMITGRTTVERLASSEKRLIIPRVEFDLHIMLLIPTDEEKTYKRGGIEHLKIEAATYYADVIKKGSPRWQYIRLV